MEYCTTRVSPLFPETADGAWRMESEGGSLKFDRD